MSAAYQPEPMRQWHRSGVADSFRLAVEKRARKPAEEIPAVIKGEEIKTSDSIASMDPGDHSRTVAVSSALPADAADDIVAGLAEGAVGWAALPAAARAQVLFDTADWMRSRRDDLAALEVFEAGKPWPEADGDVCEAIDFCEYYARQALILGEGAEVQSPPGEENRLVYVARGVAAVIGPWNFPLAIPTGMTVAALVAGNSVVLKPAEQTPAIAYELVTALRESGLPPGVLAFAPGFGEEIGAALVAHPGVSTIAFTGSKDVGLQIVEEAARRRPGQPFVKRVVAEMGGKNAMIIDDDADLDQAVPAAAQSAFGFAGQKCSAASRVLVMESVYDQFVERLVAHADTLEVGHPAASGVTVGPVIDEDAHSRLSRAVAETNGTVRFHNQAVPPSGWFVGPAIIDALPAGDELMEKELFGPVMAVGRVTSVAHALEVANNTDYALTGGVFSRSPQTVDQVVRNLRAGNVYVNRSITGSIVGRQPFGGHGLSGTGPKAGGPDYLKAFVNARAISENTIRQGFAPDQLS